jgi:hypothetical protein
MKKKPPESSAHQAPAVDRLSALVAHANGEHPHGVVEGCPACADREALWTAVMSGEADRGSTSRPWS